jgi:bacterioferritin-associated ferredoxin
MYVCICKGITEDELRKVAQTGVGPKEILKKLGVGDSCGICLIDALEGLQKSQTAPSQKD